MRPLFSPDAAGDEGRRRSRRRIDLAPTTAIDPSVAGTSNPCDQVQSAISPRLGPPTLMHGPGLARLPPVERRREAPIEVASAPVEKLRLPSRQTDARRLNAAR